MIKSFKENICVILKGGTIGVANIIPGVSGGTLAVVLGIYDRLIESIAGFFTEKDKRKEYFFFLLKIFSGAGIFILLLANLMDFLLREHFASTMFLFMGLILGGIPAVVSSHGDMKVKITRVVSFCLGVGVVMGLSYFSNESALGGTASQPLAALGFKELILLASAGFLAGGAMIVPGVSGSFILVLMGQYAIIISAIKSLEFKVLFLVALGAGSGIVVFSKIIGLLLKAFPANTYYFILGLIVASLYEIFPGVPRGYAQLGFCATTLVCGTFFSWTLSKGR